MRVSTEEQAREGVSLAAQRAACIASLGPDRIHGHEVVEDAGQSAKDTRRPGLQRVLAAVAAGGVAGVIVHKLDRLTRSVVDLYDLLARFDRTNTALVSVKEQLDTSSATGRFFVGLIALIAQWERETISERVTMGMQHRLAEGGWVGGRIPPGCAVIGEKGRKQLVVDERASPEIRQCWARVIDGWTLMRICTHLNKLGVRPASKVSRWNRQNLCHFLRAERVVGLLIDRETRDRALQVLGTRFSPTRAAVGGERPGSPGQSDRVWRLAGLARCALCGATMIGVHARGRHGKDFPYLRCSQKRKGACAAQDLPAVTWEDGVIECCRIALTEDGALEQRMAAERKRHIGNAAQATARRAELLMARDRTQQRIDRLVDLITEGDAAGKAVAPKLRELQGEAERIENEIAACDGTLAAAAMTEMDCQMMVEHLRANLDQLPTRPPTDQAAALRVLLVQATVGSDQPIELTLRVPGTAEGFVHKSRMVHQSGLGTNPVRVVFPVNVTRRAGRITVAPGAPSVGPS